MQPRHTPNQSAIASRFTSPVAMGKRIHSGVPALPCGATPIARDGTSRLSYHSYSCGTFSGILRFEFRINILFSVSWISIMAAREEARWMREIRVWGRVLGPLWD